MKMTHANMLRLLSGLDWMGHCELPDIDMSWLAAELSQRLGNPNLEICDSCSLPKAVVVPTALGPLCEDCIIEARRAASVIREQMED